MPTARSSAPARPGRHSDRQLRQERPGPGPRDDPRPARGRGRAGAHADPVTTRALSRARSRAGCPLPGAAFSCKRRTWSAAPSSCPLCSSPRRRRSPGGGVIVVTGRGLGAATRRRSILRASRSIATGSPSASNRLEDVLRDVPGFQLFRRSDARSANPTSQGATLRGLGGNASSRVLLTLDGVPQADPFGGWIAWPALDPRRLGRARVDARRRRGRERTRRARRHDRSRQRRARTRLTGSPRGVAVGSRDSIDALRRRGRRSAPASLSVSASFARGDGFVPDRRRPARPRRPPLAL